MAEVLNDPLALPRWWPSVYLASRSSVLGTRPPESVGSSSSYTKGWLPYTLRWRFKVTESRGEQGFKLVADGDFVGTGIWTLKAGCGLVDVQYDWRIRADKPLLRYGTVVFRPIFAPTTAGRWLRGEESLTLSSRAATQRMPRSGAQCLPRPDRPSRADNLGFLCMLCL